MKTTIDIATPLLQKARKVAARDGTTLRALVEQGLREVLATKKSEPFRLRKVTFRGKGLQPDFAGAGWDEIRRATYEGRGG